MAASTTTQRVPIPRDRENDYTPEAARARQEFARERTGANLEHVSSYSFDPSVLQGNVEHFVGVAQVPIGLAGPLLVNGEHAQGDSTSRSPPPRGRWWPATTAACACCTRPAA